ncbi:Dam family site-specific DNA-(adenine-N6)-methyltransferase [Mariniblastus sp.]|nr:Dam family site-specific DNA-(adenine-N6)-methyltransferase [Mariniblastus sp.]
MQTVLFDEQSIPPFKTQLLKWIGNKQRFAHEIAGYFPKEIGTYFEPFIGSGAVLATLAPKKAEASDVFAPLVEIWNTLSTDPNRLKAWYEERWNSCQGTDRVIAYEAIKASYNANPNGADFLFLCRSCYGGVVRFRKADGFMSTPCGAHKPIPPSSFAARVDLWRDRTRGTKFFCRDYKDAFKRAKRGDFIYCDPPYTHSQAILYGAQSFSLPELCEEIALCKSKGINVALSIDGTKKSGSEQCELPIPIGIFEREAFVNCGRSMLRRFQMAGQTLEGEVVSDRLLLTF